jgi:plasmid stabilization system protein ParE
MLVRITPEADQQIATIQAWWTEHRPAAPNLFIEELAGGLDIIARMPRAGRRCRHRVVPGLRRLLLRSSRYHVYYAPAGNTLFVLAGGMPNVEPAPISGSRNPTSPGDVAVPAWNQGAVR